MRFARNAREIWGDLRAISQRNLGRVALRRKTTTEALQRVQVFHRPMFRIGIVSSLILRISPQPCSSSDTARHAAPSLDARTHPQLPLFLSPSLASLAMFCSHFLIPCLRLRLSSTSREPLRAVFRPLGTCGPPTSPFQTHPIRLSAAPTAHGPRTYVRGHGVNVNKRRRGSRNTNITHRPSPFVQLQD